MSIIYPNGAGETLGDTLVTCRPLYTSGNIWYVNSAGGVDASGNAGQNREKPLATLQQAITNAADNDIIELMTGHAQTITGAAVNVNKKLTFVGAGSASGLPTVKLGINLTGDNMFAIVATNVEFRNIWFTANLQANTSARFAVNQVSFKLRGCYVECGQFDTGPAVALASGSDNAKFISTTFISTATSVTAQPESAIKVTGAISDLELDGLVLSAGTSGFSNYRAFDGSAAAITRLRGLNVSLLLGADMILNAATTGYLNPQTVTLGSRINW